MTRLLADVIAFERASIQVGEAVLRTIIEVLTGNSTEGGPDDPLTPQEHAQIRLVVWRLQVAFEEIINPPDPKGLRAALSSVSFLAEQFGNQLVAWTDLMDVLVDEAERLYGTEAGRGVYKRAQVRAAVLTLVQREGVDLPLVPDFLEPFVACYFADVLSQFVVTHLNENDLWNMQSLPKTPAMTIRLTGPMLYHGQNVFEFLGKFLTGIAWRIVMQSVRLSPGMKVAVEHVQPQIVESIHALSTITKFILNNPNYVRAWAQVLSIATQQAEAFIGMSGRRKQAYARAIILAFLEQNGVVERSGLWRTIVAAWIDVGIDSTVRLFNRRRLYPFRTPLDGSARATPDPAQPGVPAGG